MTEAGRTNFFVIWRTKAGKTQLNTAPLDSGLVLPGVTRRSVLSLAETRYGFGWTNRTCRNCRGAEKDFTIHDLIEAGGDGRLLAAFAVGTACFVKEVVEIEFCGRRIDISDDGLPHPALLGRLFSDTMYGAEHNNWTEVIESQIRCQARCRTTSIKAQLCCLMHQVFLLLKALEPLPIVC